MELHDTTLPPSARMPHLWPVADRIAVIQRSQPHRRYPRPTDDYELWLRDTFPRAMSARLAKRHHDAWRWFRDLEHGVKSPALIQCVPRGGGKSTTVETGCVYTGMRGERLFVLYVSATQLQANAHVQSIAEKLEFLGIDRSLNKYGNSRGWTQQVLRAANGFNVVSLGLDAAARGIKLDDYRPDLICHELGTLICTNDTWMCVEDHPTAQTKISNGYEVHVWGLPFPEVVTPEHRYWARSITPQSRSGGAARYIRSDDDWCEAKHLTTRHYIGMPIDMREVEPQPISYYLAKIGERNERGQVVRAVSNYEDRVPVEFADPEWWWFFGLWWGDGHLAGKYQVGVTIANTDNVVFRRVTDLLTRWGICYNIIDRPGCKQVTFSHAAFCRWLRTWKSGNAMKQPPQWVEWLRLDLQKELLRGYIAADGCIQTYDPQVRLTSVHLPALLCVRRMLARFGIAASIRKGAAPRTEHFPNGYTSISRQKYDLRFRDGASLLGFDIPDSTRYAFSRTFCKDGCLWVRVRAMQPVQDRVFVPITTETHDYLTHFGRSHNCLDDIDARHDTPAAVEKKIATITESILPSGSTDAAVVFVQNKIHDNSVMAQTLDGRADFLQQRMPPTEEPALTNFSYTTEAQPDGTVRYVLSGEPTWLGQDLAVCTAQANEWGITAFRREAQHDTGHEGRFFAAWNDALHVCQPFPIPNDWPVWGALDWGFAHPTAFGVFTQHDGVVYMIGEHVQHKWLVKQHADAMDALLGRLGIARRRLRTVVAGHDVFANRGDSDGKTIADQFAEYGWSLDYAKIDRINGWNTLQERLGNPDAQVPPTFKAFNTCHRTIAQIPALVHDPKRPEDVLKVNADADGNGGDDAADMVRYGLQEAIVAITPHRTTQTNRWREP